VKRKGRRRHWPAAAREEARGRTDVPDDNVITATK
jgi:hypothetical protein